MSTEIYKIKCAIKSKEHSELFTLIEVKDLVKIEMLSDMSNLNNINLNKTYLYKQGNKIQIVVTISIVVLANRHNKDDFINIKIDYKNNETASWITNDYNHKISSINDIIGIKKIVFKDYFSNRKIEVYLNISEEITYPISGEYGLKSNLFKKYLNSKQFSITNYLTYMDFNNEYELFLATLAFLDTIIKNYEKGIRKKVVDLYRSKLYYIGIDLEDYYKENFKESNILSVSKNMWTNKKKVMEYLLYYISYIVISNEKGVPISSISFKLSNIVATVYKKSIYSFL